MSLTLQPGDPAPDFAAPDQHGQTVRLSDLHGQKVVLYFYPKDNTSGCTKQACNLRDHRDTLQAAGYRVVGVSTDSVASHQKFVQDHDLNFTLVADEQKTIVAQYGVWQEKSMYGRKYMGTARTTFLIDETGRIAHVIEKVKTADHAAQVLKAAVA